MLLIPLVQVPNQTLSFNADNVLWTVHVYQSAKFVCADILINGVAVFNGVRCFAGVRLLQYGYMTAPNLGNFLFDEDADWTNFGASCHLFYLNQPELAQFDAASRNWTI
jgi:hypothetical protein